MDYTTHADRAAKLLGIEIPEHFPSGPAPEQAVRTGRVIDMGAAQRLLWTLRDRERHGAVLYLTPGVDVGACHLHVEDAFLRLAWLVFPMARRPSGPALAREGRERFAAMLRAIEGPQLYELLAADAAQA